MTESLTGVEGAMMRLLWFALCTGIGGWIDGWWGALIGFAVGALIWIVVRTGNGDGLGDAIVSIVDLSGDHGGGGWDSDGGGEGGCGGGGD